ncbi:hypothetical protein BD310DRAFT_826218 [Dichomitus squalens]|uniref:Uncharacterized protein n=1 Tax=Dichomitus squalens TaxID=114155 RepID=A0A4Q9PM37_9APHY|nr:hypothetical protein BD310DRAFT_826218 [Dichomitus squalens]
MSVPYRVRPLCPHRRPPSALYIPSLSLSSYVLSLTLCSTWRRSLSLGPSRLVSATSCTLHFTINARHRKWLPLRWRHARLNRGRGPSASTHPAGLANPTLHQCLLDIIGYVVPGVSNIRVADIPGANVHFR